MAASSAWCVPEVLPAHLQQLRVLVAAAATTNRWWWFFFLRERHGKVRRWLGWQESTVARRGRERCEDEKVAFIVLARPFYTIGFAMVMYICLELGPNLFGL
jgi:hypothetical protein